MSPHFTRLIPSLLLVALTAAVAASVDHFSRDEDGRRLLSWNDQGSSSEVRTGSLSYPRTAIDSAGYRVTIDRAPHRIVSEYWSIDEYLYSVVPPERIVAVSESAYLDGISNAYPFVKRFHPEISSDLERVLRLEPDLIVAPDTFRPDFCALIQDAHVPIYRAFIGFTTLRQIAETIRVTGYLTGDDDSATKVTEHFWETIEEAKAKRPANAAAPRVMGYGGQSTYGKETLFDDIITTLGGVNVAAQGGLVGYSPVNSEQIARWDPEWIVAGSAPGDAKRSVEAMLADPGIALTKAARNHRILVFDNRIFLPLSPFTVSLVKALSEALYG